MGCTVRELLSRMDSRELAEWMAYYSVEPFGDTAADVRNALLCSLLANIWRGKGQRVYRIGDFTLAREPRKKKTWKNLKDFLLKKCKAKEDGSDL